MTGWLIREAALYTALWIVVCEFLMWRGGRGLTLWERAVFYPFSFLLWVMILVGVLYH